MSFFQRDPGGFTLRVGDFVLTAYRDQPGLFEIIEEPPKPETPAAKNPVVQHACKMRMFVAKEGPLCCPPPPGVQPYTEVDDDPTLPVARIPSEGDKLRWAHKNHNWEETARQFAQDDADYYRGLLDQIGEFIGEPAYIANDGSKSEDVLRAKLPKLVNEMKNIIDRLTAKPVRTTVSVLTKRPKKRSLTKKTVKAAKNTRRK